MTSKKFKPIEKTSLGVLDGSLKAAWDLLYRDQVRLHAQQETHDRASDEFTTALQSKYLSADTMSRDSSLRVAPDGEVYVDHCKCPVCQADLHGLTVAETVEAMFSAGLITGEAINHVRDKARAVDNKRTSSKKVLH